MNRIAEDLIGSIGDLSPAKKDVQSGHQVSRELGEMGKPASRANGLTVQMPTFFKGGIPV
jgi:hypothetical protein